MSFSGPPRHIPESRHTEEGGANGETEDEHTPDRVAGGVGGCATEAVGQGEGADAGARRARRAAPPDAVDGGREGVRLRRAQRLGEPARSVRGAPATHRL